MLLIAPSPFFPCVSSTQNSSPYFETKSHVANYWMHSFNASNETFSFNLFVYTRLELKFLTRACLKPYFYIWANSCLSSTTAWSQVFHLATVLQNVYSENVHSSSSILCLPRCVFFPNYQHSCTEGKSGSRNIRSPFMIANYVSFPRVEQLYHFFSRKTLSLHFKFNPKINCYKTCRLFNILPTLIR